MNIDEIRARCEAATPGPYEANHSIPNPSVAKNGRVYKIIAEVKGSKDYGGCAYHQAIADAEFFAHAREDIPYLLSEVDRLHDLLAERNVLLDKLEAEVQHWAETEKDGRLVVLPPKCKYGNGDLDEAIRRASHMCSVTNNDVTRITLDALIEKQIREEAEARSALGVSE